MPARKPKSPIDFPLSAPSLGFILGDWGQQHCVIPDGFRASEPFVLSDEQLGFTLHHYRLKPKARPASETVKVNSAFVNRRSQLVRAQKWGKNPYVSFIICAEAVGPVVFAGWARGGEAWVCTDHGCECGWVYEYEPGEPMATTWPTPLIQITATSEDQTDNTWDALRPMIDNGPLHSVIPKTGEEFIRLPGDGRIDVVTANARSRLGQRVTFVAQDETGLWTPITGMVRVAETQRRGLAGMGGRAVETTNAWDPSERSVAQRTYEAAAADIHKDYRVPPTHLSYRNKADRRKIHRFNYAGAPWVDINSIEGEAAELVETDPGQAERFFGNRIVAGADAAFDAARWAKLADAEIVIADGALITIGFGGGRYDDTAALVATTVETGHQWLIHSWDPRTTDSGEVPGNEITDALAATLDRYELWRAYVIPDYWDTYVDDWIARWGKDKVVAWPISQRRKAWAIALRNYTNALAAAEVSHDGASTLAEHMGNARRRLLPGVRDDDGHPLWIITRERPGSNLHIDAAKAAALSWEARGDAIADGALVAEESMELVTW